MGLRDGEWFACIHIRDPIYSPIDEGIQSYRNSSIQNLKKAVDEIRRRGGVPIRIGTSTLKINSIDNLIDYPNSVYKSDKGDIVLCAKARFILGNTSGIALLGSVFGTPCALANMIPMSVMGIGINDLSIPKLLMSDNSILKFEQIMNSELSNFRNTDQYIKNSIMPLENSEEDILLLAVEMLNLLEGKQYQREEVMMQKNFKKLFKAWHYGYGAESNISSKFLKKYEYLWDINGAN